MKRLSLQWRITLLTVLLIGITCVAMNLLLCSSGVYYMDTIADSLQGGSTVILNEGGVASFDPQLIAPNEELTIVVDGAQGRFRTTNWYITCLLYTSERRNISSPASKAGLCPQSASGGCHSNVILCPVKEQYKGLSV